MVRYGRRMTLLFKVVFQPHLIQGGTAPQDARTEEKRQPDEHVDRVLPPKGESLVRLMFEKTPRRCDCLVGKPDLSSWPLNNHAVRGLSGRYTGVVFFHEHNG